MADVFQLLIEILRIDTQLVNQYAAQGPLYQIFYLLFFPTLFIIVLIWILSHRVMEHKGLRLLIALAVYAFIILQGWYNFFVHISTFWLIGLIILGFLYMLFYRTGGGAGQPRAKTLGSKGKAGGVLNFLEDVTGKKFNPKDIAKFKNMIDRDIKRLLLRKKTLEKRASELKHDPQAANFIYNQIAQIDQALATLENFKQAGSLGDYEDWRKTNSHLLGL